MRPDLVLMIGIAVLVCGGLGFVFGSWARAKGYAFLLGLLLVILCTPLVAAIILMVLPKRDPSVPTPPRRSAEDKGIEAIAEAYKRAAPRSLGG